MKKLLLSLLFMGILPLNSYAKDCLANPNILNGKWSGLTYKGKIFINGNKFKITPEGMTVPLLEGTLELNGIMLTLTVPQRGTVVNAVSFDSSCNKMTWQPSNGLGLEEYQRLN